MFSLKTSSFLVAALFLFFACSADAQLPPQSQARTETQTESRTLERNDSERRLFELLNHERTEQGLPELRWDDALFKAARQHALRMLNLNTMEHQLPGEPGLEERLTAAGTRFTSIAENIAYGGNVQTIHDGWMGSPGHRKNILEARFTAVGIAVVRGNNGLFAVEDFSQVFVNLTAEQQEKQVAALLVAQGFRVNGEAKEARKACDGAPETGTLTSYALVRFEAPDLKALPPEVEKKIHDEARRTVAVGACRVPEAPGFARYRVVLLFF